MDRSYSPEPSLEIHVAKAGSPGETRPIALATVRDKLVQHAVRLVIEPICERRFLPSSYGYRPGRGPLRAIRRVRHELSLPATRSVVPCDVRRCFDEIPHGLLLDRLHAFLPDHSIDWLVERFLANGVVAQTAQWSPRARGIPQGAVLSPLLANVHLHALDEALTGGGIRHVRYADDLLLFAGSEPAARRALEFVRSFAAKDLGLEISSEGGALTAGGPFSFLGIEFCRGTLRIDPQKRKEVCAQLDGTAARLQPASAPALFTQIAEKLDGWRQYYGALVEPGELAAIDAHLAQAIGGRAGEFERRRSLSALRRHVERIGWLGAATRDARRALEHVAMGRRALAADPTPRRPARQERRYAVHELESSQLVVEHPGAFVARRGGRLVVRSKGRAVGSFRLEAVRHLMLAGRGTSCSSEVLRWAAENDVRVSFLDHRGRVYARVEGARRAGSHLLRAQARALGSPLGARIARDLVRAKIRNQRNLLSYLFKYESRARSTSAATLTTAVAALRSSELAVAALTPVAIDSLRGTLFGLEGSAAAAYWKAFGALLGGFATFSGRTRQGATDLVNVLLNYGYGILYAEVEGACGRAGLDPSIGFLHTEGAGDPVLVFDLIEPFRAPIVDRAILTLLRHRESIRLDEDGTLGEDARRRIAHRVLARLAAFTRYRGKRCRMDKILEQQCQELAAALTESAAQYRPFICSW
jgi:CRISPR-associated endonuclease Cas1/group II intron reverse transcriptase/maturase